MMQVTFTLRTLTPLFLSGADQTSAELRAPSFRGLMHYWHRALVGGLVGGDEQSLQQVMKAETAVFGATDVGSTVTIRVSEASRQPIEFTERISERVGGSWQATGKGYLLWSMAKSGSVEKKNFKAARWYFPAETSFHITLSSRSQDDIGFKQAIAALWLLVHLGGVGSRSRRCAGSLFAQVTENKDIVGLSFDEPVSIKDLQKHLSRGIEVARTLHALKPLPINYASFDVIAKNVCRIWILHNNGKAWHSASDAMYEIGAGLQAGRQSIRFLDERQIFGLPLGKNKARRASPLLLRITKLQGEQYVGVAVLFKTMGKGIQSGDYKLIEGAMNKFPGRYEVDL